MSLVTQKTDDVCCTSQSYRQCNKHACSTFKRDRLSQGMLNVTGGECNLSYEVHNNSSKL